MEDSGLHMDCARWSHEVSLYDRQFMAVQHTARSRYLQVDFQAVNCS